VALDKVGLTDYGDTDISVIYYTGSAWVLLEDNSTSSDGNRTADVSAGAQTATKWSVAAKIGESNDAVKIKSIDFNTAPPPPPSILGARCHSSGPRWRT
jgi:hypothetical protein